MLRVLRACSLDISIENAADPRLFILSPGQWDVAYYKQTYNYAKTGVSPPGVFVFPSDQKLATYQEVGKKFQGFIDNQNKWGGKFADA
jgi:hypothetical protein